MTSFIALFSAAASPSLSLPLPGATASEAAVSASTTASPAPAGLVLAVVVPGLVVVGALELGDLGLGPLQLLPHVSNGPLGGLSQELLVVRRRSTGAGVGCARLNKLFEGSLQFSCGRERSDRVQDPAQVNSEENLGVQPGKLKFCRREQGLGH